jgi:hypothetical protein
MVGPLPNAAGIADQPLKRSIPMIVELGTVTDMTQDTDLGESVDFTYEYHPH